MKAIRHTVSLLSSAALCAALCATGSAYAQTNSSGSTRAEKKAELQRLERNGYRPAYNDPHYPDNLQNAEQRSNGFPGTSTNSSARP